MTSIASLIKAAAQGENLRMMEDRTMSGAPAPFDREQWIANAERERRERSGTNTLGGAAKNFGTQLGGFMRGMKGAPPTLTPQPK